MIEIVTTFLASSQGAKLTIIGINIMVSMLLCIAFFRLKDNSIKGVVFCALYTALYFLIAAINMYLPLSYFVLLYVFPSIVLALFFYGIYYLAYGCKKESSLGGFDIEIPYQKGKKLKINIKRGVSVQGAAGSGKTISIAGWILYWLGKRNIPGLVYDYKDFEFVEIVQWFYRNSKLPLQVFAPHAPNKSIQINPIAIEILKNPEDVTLMSKCIVENLLGAAKGNDKFFIEAAEGAITGAILVLKEKYPQFCSFSYLAGVFLTKEAEELVSFIEQSENATLHARSFLDSAMASKQMAAVKASLSNAFRAFATPSIFYSMHKNSVPLSINKSENKIVLCLVNSPKYDDIYSPILSIVTQAVITSMSSRDQDPSYILLDEAPTLKINRIGKVPATMRSFNIATIYMLQDKIQAQIQIGIDRMKEILTNLNTQFFGKTNDPDTAEFIEKYFEMVKVKMKSVSRKPGWMGGTDRRISESEREEKVHKSYEMFKRSTGEFFVFDENGTSYDAMIEKPEINPIGYKDQHKVSAKEIEDMYNLILLTAKNL